MGHRFWVGWAMDFLISMVAGVFGFSLVLFVLFVIVVFSIKLPPRQDVQ